MLGTIFLGGKWAINKVCAHLTVTLGERRPKDRGERHRCEVVLGGSGGMHAPQKFLKFSLNAISLTLGEDLIEIRGSGNGIITCRN